MKTIYSIFEKITNERRQEKSCRQKEGNAGFVDFIVVRLFSLNVVKASVKNSAILSCATYLFLPHFDVICDLLLNRRTATWNLFVLYNNEQITTHKTFAYFKILQHNGKLVVAVNLEAI